MKDKVKEHIDELYAENKKRLDELESERVENVKLRKELAEQKIENGKLLKQIKWFKTRVLQGLAESKELRQVIERLRKIRYGLESENCRLRTSRNPSDN